MVLSTINLHIKLYGYKSRFISFFLCFPDDSSYVALQEELSFHVYPQRLEDVVDHCVVVGDLVDVGSVQLHCVEGRKRPLYLLCGVLPVEAMILNSEPICKGCRKLILTEEQLSFLFSQDNISTDYTDHFFLLF